MTGESDESTPEIEDIQKQVIEEVPSAKVGLIIYVALIFFSFYFLNSSKSDIGLSSPWQTISVSYIYLFFAATAVLGSLLFSKLKSGTLLFLLIVHTFLLHSYLPLSHTFFYGADGWRHLAIQNSMLLEGVGKTLTFSVDPINFWQRFNFGSLAYAQFNSLALLFKFVCGLDLVVFLRYFIVIIWSVVLPILLFEIARALNWEKKRALFFVWLSLLPFALQVSGSFSLPSNLSLLFWLLLILLQFKNSQNTTLIGQITILILGSLTLFGHSLYLILFGLSFVLFAFFGFHKKTGQYQKTKLIFASTLSVLLIPALELITNFSKTNSQISWWTQLKAIAGSFSGWYVATGLRVSDITAGNIFFNQPPLNALFENIFTANRLWIFGFMCLFWIAFVFGVYKMLNKQKNNLNSVWIILTIGLFGGYVISRYFLLGENILSRRLDSVLAILFILPVGYSLYEMISVQKNIFKQKTILILVILVCSVAITASYTLGPDAQIVSSSQYSAADYIWQKNKNSNTSTCVLSDTYTLLILEGLSGKKIVGGGFPMNLYFNQPELIRLQKLVQTQPDLALVQAKNLLNTDSCYLVGEYNMLNPEAQFDNIKVYKN